MDFEIETDPLISHRWHNVILCALVSLVWWVQNTMNSVISGKKVPTRSFLTCEACTQIMVRPSDCDEMSDTSIVNAGMLWESSLGCRPVSQDSRPFSRKAWYQLLVKAAVRYDKIDEFSETWHYVNYCDSWPLVSGA